MTYPSYLLSCYEAWVARKRKEVQHGGRPVTNIHLTNIGELP